MDIFALFDKATSTLTYVVSDPESRDAVVIDPVMDFEPASGATGQTSVQAVLSYLNSQKLKLRAVLETHAHADHLSGSQLLKSACPQHSLVIGSRIVEVQRAFAPVFGFSDDVPLDGSQFDHLLSDGEVFSAGTLQIETINTPGHTPACVTYRIGDALFTGDALFMPDSGTGRCDFPGGNAQSLYHSVHERLYSLPDELRVFVGHDYQPGGRELRYETTLGEQKRNNLVLRAETTQEGFVAFREQRDATLPAPRLLFQSVQVNVQAGHLPAPVNGMRWLRIPLNSFHSKGAPAALTLDTCESPSSGGRQG